MVFQRRQGQRLLGIGDRREIFGDLRESSHNQFNGRLSVRSHVVACLPLEATLSSIPFGRLAEGELLKGVSAITSHELAGATIASIVLHVVQAKVRSVGEDLPLACVGLQRFSFLDAERL